MQSPLHKGAWGTYEGHTHCSAYFSSDPDAAVLLGESRVGRSTSYTIMLIMPCIMKFHNSFKSSEVTHCMLLLWRPSVSHQKSVLSPSNYLSLCCIWLCYLLVLILLGQNNKTWLSSKRKQIRFLMFTFYFAVLQHAFGALMYMNARKPW